MTNITIPVYTCSRCSHEWVPRVPTLPKRCPQCKSPYWQRPRKEADGQNNRPPG